MIVRMCDNLIYELSKNQSKMLQQAGEFIDEIVLCGGYLIDEIREKDSYVYNHNTRIILMLIGNVLEKLDSVGVLLKNGCTEGLIPIQRTIVEMYFSIMFIFKDDFEEKIIAYDVCHINERILSGAVIKKKANFIELKKIEDKVKELEKMLGQDEYRKLNCIWEKLYNRKKYPPEWYQIISDKCSSVKGIAKKINKIDMYEAMYGHYSKEIHGTLALKNYVCLDEPAFKVKKFRVPSMVHILCEQNLVIFSQIYNKIVEKYLDKEHEEDFDRWYFQKKEQLKVILEAEKNINKFK